MRANLGESLQQSRRFSNQGSYLEGNIFNDHPGLSQASFDWNGFADSWNNLLLDRHMADGGNYRYRRYSEFEFLQSRGEFSLLPHRPYQQSKEINYLNGGVDRLYSPIERKIQLSTVMQALLKYCVFLIGSKIDSSQKWVAQVFQNRIHARAGGVDGEPTPEGMHRDGVDFVMILMINRVNVQGGISSVFDGEKKLLKTKSLSMPGDYFFLDDNRTFHSASSISSLGIGDGYRDALIVMLTGEGAPS